MRAEYSPAFRRASTLRRGAGAGCDDSRSPVAEHIFASRKALLFPARARPILTWNDASTSCRAGRGRPPRGSLREDRMSRPAMLLVDHDEATRLQLKERIAAVCPPGMEVLTARSAEEALGILYSLRGQHRTIELVIATQGMPGIPGGRF